MKRFALVFIGVFLIGLCYYLLSLTISNGNFHFYHRYAFETIEEANKSEALLYDEMKVVIETDSSSEMTEFLEQNLQVWVTKSMYREFYGFLISWQREDTNSRCIIIENTDYENTLLEGLELHYNGRYKGTIHYASIHLPYNQILEYEIVKRKSKKVSVIGLLKLIE